MKNFPRVALAHDYLNQWGGGERVLKVFTQIWPQADIFTTTYDPEKITEFSDKKIQTTFIQKLPFGIKKYKWYLALMPKAVASLDLKKYDLIISDSSGFIKGVRKGKQAFHICYIHTPTRYLTVDQDYFRYTAPKITHLLIPLLFTYLRRKDLEGAKQPDYYIANSKTIAERVKKYYHREVDAIVFPPVDTSLFYRKKNEAVKDFFLVAGRLVPYKRTDLAIEACNRLGRKLVIIGTGPDEEALRKSAGPLIEFRGKVSDADLRQAYASCQALLFPPLEDAGITPLEAMACGRPVIAYGKGGVLESVVDGKSGIFFPEQTVESLIEAIKKYEKAGFSEEIIMRQAQNFSAEIFKEKIKKLVEEFSARGEHK